MDDEFKLCWKNFQDNIASGFQNLYDRGDLVDVTLACDGKLLHAHKIVLAICSPYFQEIFITNPCKHPIIILKDVTFNIMCELLEFMYQGVVNVKHTELQSFMKIGQLLQIKGLATNTSSSAASTSSDKSSSQIQNQSDEVTNTCNDAVSSASNAKNPTSETNNNAESVTGSNSGKAANATTASSSATAVKTHSPASSPSPMGFANYLNQSSFKSSSSAPESNVTSHHHASSYHSGAGASSMKRHSDFNTDALSIYSRKQFRRSAASADHNSSEHNDGAETGVDQVNAEDFFMPHISMVESRYDLNSVKREGEHHGLSNVSSASSLRNSFGPSAFNFDYNLYKNSNTPSSAEYPNDLHLANDYKNFGNHMDIPPNSSNVVMLSSTSLLHGNCVFNRNNTVATQQGMKTYWLCKSYRISMCRARCITHQGRVISATGVHNHPPHMRGGNGGGGVMATSGYGSDGGAQPLPQPGPSPVGPPPTNMVAGNIPMSLMSAASGGGNMAGPNANAAARLHHQPVTAAASSSMYQHNMHVMPQQQQQPISPPPAAHHHLTQSLPNLLVQHHPSMPENNQVSLHHQHAAAQAQNSVIQNMMHNVNIMHLPSMHQQHQQHQQHSPHLSEHTPHHHHQHQQSLTSSLEITPLVQSSPAHMHSPSARSNQSHHGANSLSSPISSAGASVMKSPRQTNMSEDAHHMTGGGGGEQHVMGHNAMLSPTEVGSNTAGSAEANASSQVEVVNEATHHQAQVIDSITISPGNSHSFKIEDM